MTWVQFLLVFGLCALTMLACRVIPLFLLKGKELPENVSHALNLIPPAAFAALVANDLFSPGTFSNNTWQSMIPFVASAIVVIVAVKTKSLLWCVLSGVGMFAVLMLIG